MKLSVAMCTFNGGLYLQEQLQSIATQARLPDELIICDDRSTDQTGEIAQSFAAHAPFPVRLYVNEERLGSTKNFEKAIGLCTGEIIALADQDDVWHSTKLAQIELAFLARPKLGLVFSDLEIVDEQLKPLGYSAWQSIHFDLKKRRLVNAGRPLNVLLKYNVVTGCAMAFRARWRDLILPIPKFEHKIIHDYWIALLIAAVSEVSLINRALVKYRQHASQQLGLASPFGKDETQKLIYWSRKRLDLQPLLLEALKTRLAAVGAAENYLRCLKDVERRRAHVQRRLKAKDLKAVARTCYALRELLTLRYFRYSEGWSDVLRDVMPATIFNLCKVVARQPWLSAIRRHLDSRKDNKQLYA